METVVAVLTDLFFGVKITEAAKQAGRTVITVAELELALAMARQRKPVLMVVDLSCPAVDAVELARRLKADPELRSIRLLGFVPHVQTERKAAALAAGFDEVVARSTFATAVGKLIASA